MVIFTCLFFMYAPKILACAAGSSTRTTIFRDSCVQANVSHTMNTADTVFYVQAEAVLPSAPSVIATGYSTTPDGTRIHRANSDPNRSGAGFLSNTTPPVPPSTSRNTVNEAGVKEYLAGHKWPHGLQLTFVANLQLVPIRFFICDDSGSMMISDGHKLMTAPNGQQKFVTCTRWQELTDALKFHAGLAKASGAPTEFRLLNGSPPIRIGLPDDQDTNRYNTLLNRFEQSPSGNTPLCKHIREVTIQIGLMEAQLRASGQKACVIIATDGESSDGDIVTAMQPLRSMPVWVVVRLCTDEDRIVEYWNNIDSQLELDMDVLDDLSGEAGEVMENNSWLTYGEPMHRLREFGVLIKEIDMMDSNKLSLDQIRRFCSIIFGGSVDSYPHPELDFPGFLDALDKGNKNAGKVWDPVSQKPRDWIDKEKLRKMAGKGSCVMC